jgi:transposase-like protein
MNIIQRGAQWLHALRHLVQRTAWDERPCPHCGQHATWKHGTYRRQPWTLSGRQTVVMQRYWCCQCRRTFTPPLAPVAARCWYGRDVQRCALDQWIHAGSSVRRVAEWVRSLAGRQERWWQWRPWEPRAAGRPCRLGASTVHRWLDAAGQRAQTTIAGQWRGVPTSGQLGADGLWARLVGTARRVVLLLTDSVTGVVYPPVVVATEDGAAPWAALFHRAAHAGLRLERVRGVTSDGARGLGQYLEQTLVWVHHQRGVFHVWRNLAAPLADAVAQATTGRRGAPATAARRATKRALTGLVRAVLDAMDDAAAVAALRQVAAHPRGVGLATALRNLVGDVLVYREPWNQGLVRVGPEWWWRDFRVRLSHGRNHRSAARLERAALVWAMYHNFEPAQGRKERQRTYRRAGRSPLAMAGVPPGEVSYLDALAV